MLLLTLSGRAEMPQGWELYTTSPKLYQGTRETGQAAGGKACGLLRGTEAPASKYALLLQKISAKNYRGHRVRLSAQVSTEGLTGWAGLFMRIDGANGESLAFDNMEDRPLKGSQSWKTVTVEMDVPPEAVEIHYGLVLCGGGEARVDDLTLEGVDVARPTAASASRVRSLPRQPVNPDFER